MLAEVVRSGLVEARHDGVVAVVDGSGTVVASSGDIEQPFYGRSSLKPFQALVSQRHGAALADERLAIACASHAGLPVHLAAVRSVLAGAGLDEAALATPAAVPSSADGIAAAARDGRIDPAPILHNCSGKHAATLAACVASGYPVASYLDRTHPLQVAVADHLAELFGGLVGDPGVDGCGLPAHVVTARSMAGAFATLGLADDYGAIRDAMVSYPVLIGDVGRVDGVLSAAGLPAKVGAEGCIGVAVPDLGLGIVVKAWDGSERPLGPVVADVLDAIGLDHDLHADLAAPVLGSGRPVGEVRSVVRL